MREDTSPPVVWTMIFLLWHVFMNSEDIYSAPFSSIWMNAAFLSWFLNIVTRSFRMSRGGSLILDGNPKGVWSSRTYIHKIRGKSKYDFNIEIRKIHMKHEPRGNFRFINDCTSMSFSCLGQETNSTGLLQVRYTYWETLCESFYCN